MAAKYENLIVEDKGDIWIATIHRPGDRNSINGALMDDVDALLVDAEKAKVRAIIYTGGDETYFIGGADGTIMMQCKPDEVGAFSLKFHGLLNRMEDSPLINVAAINGLCFGGGYEFALACDLRIASPKARVGLLEVRVGLIPGGGGTQRLPRLVGVGKAMEMILTGNGYKGEEALKEGLVTTIVPHETLMADAEKYVRENLFRNPQYALVLGKRAVNASRNGSLADGLKEENKQFKKCLEHDYFVKLMCKQIKEGILKTTTKLPEWVYK
jgi:enoyl-CoA hydratase/carnithine racemase